MFRSSSFNQSIENWDVSNVTIMIGMFQQSPFNQPIGNWNVSNVINMSYMFHFSQFNQPVGNWDVSNVTSMWGMFSGTPFNHPIGDWDVSSVTDMAIMFYGSSFNLPIGDWDVSSVTRMWAMFWGSQFNQPIGNWNVSSVTDMRDVFWGSQFDQPIVEWDVSIVTTMAGMFKGSQFNQALGNWDVINVTDMDGMFESSQFNQPINNWCVAKITSEPQNFSSDSPLTLEYKPNWGTCIGLPNQLLLLAPENSSVNVSRTPQLSWKPDTISTKYQLQLFEGINLTVVDTLISDTLYTNASSLTGNIVYSWRVRGINENLTNRVGEWSEVWSFTTGVDTSIDTEEVPTQFVLNQNYPNPFNPTTQIQFSLPVSTVVRLEVFSVLGQRTVTLLNEHLPVGEHTVPFDGRSLSSGVYIYRLTTPEYTQSRLMNLIK
jgi:surface protein